VLLSTPVEGVVVTDGPGDQIDPVITNDGTGGAVVVWSDLRGEKGPRLLARRILAQGTPDPSWPSDGVGLSDADANQREPVLASDGFGGVYAVWQDNRTENTERLFLQHVNGTGVVDPSWTKNGLELSEAKGYQTNPQMLVGSDEIFVAWLDRQKPAAVRGFAQRVLRDGRIDPVWPPSGAPLSSSSMENLVLAAGTEAQATVLWRVPPVWDFSALVLAAKPPVVGEAPAPAITMLFAPRPNPARGNVTFHFSLSGRLAARLVVFDVQGRRVATPLDRVLDPGPHDVTWNRSDARGNNAKSGIYFVRFDAENRQFTRRFVLVR
jgi:hypothetical protein